MKKFVSVALIFSLLVHPLGVAYAYGPHQVLQMTNTKTGLVAVKFDYDANGNMITKNDIEHVKLWQYEYDIENRLVKVRCNSKLIEAYKYDSEGGRIEKKSFKADGVSLESRVEFIGKIQENIYDSNGKTYVSHIYTPGGSRIATVTAGEVAYYLPDHLGSSSVMVNADGVVIEKTEYDPHGKTSLTSKSGTTKNAKQFYFTGKYLDSKTGLYYYGARYYDPEIAKFITPDTVIQDYSDTQAYNRYAYVRNNPVNGVDPSGHMFWFIAAIVKAIIATAVAHPVIVGAAVAGATAEVSAMRNGSNFFQAYAGAIGPTVMGGAVGGLGAMAPGAGPLKWALAGGAIGAAGAGVSGGDVGQGFLNGAIGGAAMWAGGSVMAQKFAMAGLMGNMVSSGGMSMIENGMMGIPGTSRYQVYLGPLSISLAVGHKPQFGLSSLSSMYYLGKGIIGPAKFNLWQTISSGAPVFQQGYGGLGGKYGRTLGGNIFLGPDGFKTGPSVTGQTQWVLGHERIHANIQGRMGGAWGATDLVTQSALSTQSLGNVADGSKRQVPALGGPDENPFELQAATFGLWGQ